MANPDDPTLLPPTVDQLAPAPEAPFISTPQDPAVRANSYEFDAFISYRHVDPDRKMAIWLHNQLEKYRVPKRLMSDRGLPRRLRRVFRDEEELAASSDLGRELESALRKSRYLIVICSPRTPASEWVSQEVKRFREWGRDDRILALLIEGEPRNSFPKPLCEIRRKIVGEAGQVTEAIEEVEPLAADVRPRHSEKAGHIRSMARLRVLASLLGCRFDELRQREQERQTRRLFLAGALLASLAVLLAALTVFAFSQRNEAERQRENVEAARQKIEAEQKKALALLDRQYVANGLRYVQAHDYMGALPWFVRAWKISENDPERALIHRIRIASTLQHCPRPVQIWFNESGGNLAEFTPDGKRLLIGNLRSLREEGAAWVADIATGSAMTARMSHQGLALRNAALSRDGRRVVTIPHNRGREEAGEARLWDVALGKPACPPFRHTPLPDDKEDAFRGRAVVDAEPSPDGRFAVTASDDHTARLWDAATGQPVGLPLRHGDEVIRAVFSPDSRRVVTASDRLVRIWEVPSGRPLTESLSHDASVDLVRFHPSGRWIVTATRSGSRVWDAGSGALVSKVNYFGGPLSLDFSPDGRQFLVGLYQGEARVWDTFSGEPVTPILKHPQNLLYARWSPDGLTIITGSHDRTAQVWDAGTGAPVYPHLRQGGWVHHVGFSPDARYAVAAGDEVSVWDLATEAALIPQLEHRSLVRAAYFSTDGQRIATISDELSSLNEAWCRVTLWDAQSLRPLGRPRLFATVDFMDSVYVAFSPDLRQVLGRRGKETRVWNTLTGEPVTPPLQVTDSDGFTYGWFSLDGSMVVLHDGRHRPRDPGFVRVFDASTGQALTPPLKQPNQARGASFSPDGRLLAVVSSPELGKSSDLLIWDIASARPLRSAQVPYELEAVTFSPDGQRLVTLGHNGGAQIWEVATGKPLTEPIRAAVAGYTLAAEFSPDGRSLLTATGDMNLPFQLPHREGEAAVWDLESRQLRFPVLKHTAGVRYAKFSPDGRLLVTASWDGTARVWDARTGEPVTPPLPHPGRVQHASFSPDGRRLITAGWDGKARLWNLTPTEMPSEDAELLALLFGRFRIDEHGVESTVAEDVIQSAWKTLKEKYPSGIGNYAAREPRDLPGPSDLLWHQRRAEWCEREGQWLGVVSHLDPLLSAQADNWRWRARRAYANAALGRHDDALTDYRTAYDQGDDIARDLYELAALQVQQDDRDGYRRTCARLSELRKKGPVAAERAWVAEAYCLDPHSGLEPATLLELAQSLRDFSTRLEQQHGMIAARLWYRAGEYQKVVDEWRFKGFSGKDLNRVVVRDRLYLAMAQARLGQTKQAQETRGKAEQWLDQMERELLGQSSYEPWEAVLELRMLRRETERCLSR